MKVRQAFADNLIRLKKKFLRKIMMMKLPDAILYFF